MRHQSPNDFAAAPERGRGRGTESDLVRSLQQRFRPQERARTDAQRVDDEPQAIAAGFAAEIDGSRAEHYAVVRAEAMNAVVSNTDTVGALVVAADPGEVDQAVRDADTRLDRVDMERRKEAAKSIDVWLRGCAAYEAWADLSGAKLRQAPWPGLAFSLLVVVFAELMETWLCAQLLEGPPIVGVPAPLMLGLLFAGGSLSIGALVALGHMLAADKRSVHRLGGFVLFALALAGWILLCLMGAHMRATIEAGGGGTVPEIRASIDAGLFAPLISPMALLLAAASAFATAAVWFEAVNYFGAPFSHRAKDAQRSWCVVQLNKAEEDHKDEIKGVVGHAVDGLDTLEQVAWKPANDAVRLEREVQLIVAQARESERAVDRAHRGQLTIYGNTFRRVRPGVDLTYALSLDQLPEEALGDPVALHAGVVALGGSASDVSSAVAEGKIRLRKAEVSHLTQIDKLYGETRRQPPRRDPTDLAPIR